MRHLALLVLLPTISSFAVAGRRYRLVPPPRYYDSWRQKRQSHPLATQVRFPELSLADSVSLTTEPPPEGSDRLPEPLVDLDSAAQPEPELADYLTPPPPPGGDQAPRQQPAGKWDLGFNANEILVPPAEKARNYDTLKLFTLVPSSGEAERGFENAIQSILEQVDSAAAGSGQFGEGRPPHRDRRPARQHQPEGQGGPLFTYVKTDKFGNFKWGVRHGQ